MNVHRYSALRSSGTAGPWGWRTRMEVGDRRCLLMLVELAGTWKDHTWVVGAGPLRLAGHSDNDCSPERK